MGNELESDTEITERCPACIDRKTHAINAERFIVGVLIRGKCDRCTYTVEVCIEPVGQHADRRASV